MKKKCNICNKKFVETLSLGKHPCADTFLKTKKQVSSIPVMLAYKKGNTMVGADYSVVGANKESIDIFFNQVLNNEKK